MPISRILKGSQKKPAPGPLAPNSAGYRLLTMTARAVVAAHSPNTNQLCMPDAGESFQEQAITSADGSNSLLQRDLQVSDSEE